MSSSDIRDRKAAVVQLSLWQVPSVQLLRDTKVVRMAVDRLLNMTPENGHMHG